jgi:predicted phosphodiesterase
MTKKRIIVLSITFTVIIALGFWVKSRMGAWFHNPEEPAFEAVSTPSRILLTFGNNGEQSRMLSWQYDSIPTTGWVELVTGKDTVCIVAKAQQVISHGGKSVYYQVELNNLKWDSTYQYCVNHPSVKSDFFRFSMPDSIHKEFSFIYVGDVQDSVNGIFPVVMQHIRQRNPNMELYLFGGDLIERPHDQYWNEFFRSVDSTSQTTPIVAIAGNHEYIKGIPRKLEERFTLVFPYFHDKTAGESNHVFTFKYKNAQFFLLDSNVGIYGLYKQRQWLRNELEQSSARWKIVSFHHPVYSIRGRFNNLFVRMMLNPVLKAQGVDLVLQGHEHGYARISNKENTTPLYIISHNAPKTYKHTLNGKVDKYFSDSRYYQRIDVGADTLRLQVFDLKDSLIDNVSIDHKTKQIQSSNILQ